jgi:3'(2'), 5'-bisphosphate nucleotidase
MLDALSGMMREVGASLRGWLSDGGAEGSWDGTQYHAKADEWAHQMICAGLSRLHTQYPVISEEDRGGPPDFREGRYWLIDPIDGTASYIAGFSGYVTQLALMDHGEPLIAVVYAPATDEMFVANRGSGAFMNGRRLPYKTTLGLTLIDNYPEPRGMAAGVYNDLSFKGYIESGSLGLKICRVAEGSADAFAKDVPVRDWDVAGPELILSEAGGRLTDLHGQSIKYTGRGTHQGLVASRDALLGRNISAYLVRNVLTAKLD